MLASESGNAIGKPFPRIILVWAAVDWSIYMRRPMVSALAESAAAFGSTVVAVDRPLCPFSTIVRKPARLTQLFGGPRLERLAPNLFLYHPKYVIHDQFANGVPFLERLNLASLRRSYGHLQKQLGITEPSPMIWYNYPQQGYVVDLFDSSFCIFEIYDNLTDLIGGEAATVGRLMTKRRGRVDLLLTTSQKIHDKYASGYRRSFLFGNGLDRKSFQRLSDPATAGSPEIMAIPSPRIGYAGMISERLDWNLIIELARLEPNWNFVFAGRVADSRIYDRVKETPNVRLLGDFDHSQVPAILRSFDVGIMPYQDTPFFHFLNPLKFYDLAAAGLASVSSNIEHLRQFPSDLVQVVPNRADAWREALRRKLDVDRNIARRIGPEVAGRFIWEDMTASLLHKIQDDYL